MNSDIIEELAREHLRRTEERLLELEKTLLLGQPKGTQILWEYVDTKISGVETDGNNQVWHSTSTYTPKFVWSNDETRDNQNRG